MQNLALENRPDMAKSETGIKLGLQIHPIKNGRIFMGTTSYLANKVIGTHVDMVELSENLAKKLLHLVLKGGEFESMYGAKVHLTLRMDQHQTCQ